MRDSKKILFSLLWNHGTWERGNVTPEELEQAKRDGYVFDKPDPISHDETLARLRKLTDEIDPQDVANAFLYSLSTRDMEYRSALGSYWYAKAIPDHPYHGRDGKYPHCYACCWSSLSRNDTWNDYNYFNFMRCKWGGVGHTNPEYCLFDLQQFQKLPRVVPTEADWQILYAVLDTITELEPKKKAGALRQLITKKKLLKSNADEVPRLLGILGICGILASEEAPGYCDLFVNEYQRAPAEHTNDMYYPLNRWHASDGVNEEWFFRVFGRSYQKEQV